MDAEHSLVELSGGNFIYAKRAGPQHQNKPTIVMVPGWAYSCEVFQPLQALLAKHYDTLSFDPRGHGRSSNDHGGHSYTQHGHDLNELIEKMNLRHIVLLGWSLGCYDCLCYLQQSSSRETNARIRALILADESPKIVKDEDNLWGEGNTDEVNGLIELVASDAYLDFFSDYMKEGYRKTQPDEKTREQFCRFASRLAPEEASQLLSDARSYDFREFLRQIDKHIPLQFIVREDWAREAQQWVLQNCSNADFNVLGGHLALLEMPERFHSITSAFLSQLSSR